MSKVYLSTNDMKDVLKNPHGHDVVWPTGEDKKLALSYSKMSTFKNCPRQYAESNIWQTVKFKETEATRWGNRVHKALENYVFKEEPIKDKAIKPFASVADSLIKKENRLYERGILVTKMFGEQDWACDLTMRQHSYYDNDGLFLRGKADVGMGTKNTLFLYDYKTGAGKYPDPSQLELMGLMAMAQGQLVPESVTKIDGQLLYLEARKTIPFTMPTSEYKERWTKWVKLAFNILDSIQRDSFPEKQSGLCEKSCGCFNCPFNKLNPDGTLK